MSATTPTPPAASHLKSSFTSPRLASHDTETGEVLTVRQWLDNIKKGWGDKYGSALEEEGGYEDVDDLAAAPPTEDELKEYLAEAKAKRPQIVRIATAIQELASVKSKKESISSTLAVPSGSSATGHTTPLWKLKKKYACFLSHFKFEAATEARLCQMELEKMLGCPVFLDSDNLNDLRELLEHVRNCDVLVLLQTTGLLSRPWCLLEIYTAIKSEIPIVAINIKGAHPYDYADAADFLENLDTRLEEANEGASQLLMDQGIDLLDAAYLLSSVLPNIISTELHVSGSRNVLAAQLADVVNTMQTCKPLKISQESKDMWLERRKRRNDSYAYRREHGKNISELASSKESEVKDQKLLERANIKIAVSFSSLSDPKQAARDAFIQLRTKLSNCTLSCLWVVIGGYDFCEVIEELHSLLPPTTPVIAVESMMGMIVDGQYFNDNGRFLGLQGIFDADGIYEPFCATFSPASAQGTSSFDTGLSHEQHLELEKEVSKDTAEQVQKAYVAGSTAAMEREYTRSPQFALVFSSGSYADAALEAMFGVIGEVVPTVGGGLIASFTSALPPKVAIRVGSELKIFAEQPAMVGFFAWPSVHCSGAFCSGLQADHKNDGGVITKMRGPNIVEEIDEKPASEVMFSWHPDSINNDYIARRLEEAKTMGMENTYSFVESSKIDFVNGSEHTVPHNPLGAVVGVDQNSGDAIHKIACPTWVNPKGGFSTLVGLEVGMKLAPMVGRKDDILERTARVAGQVVKNTGLDLGRIKGCFSYSCGLNIMISGSKGLGKLAERLSDTLGWVPTLGLCGGPEFGIVAPNPKSAVGSCKYSIDHECICLNICN